jgi:hypothetical protein
MTELRFVQLGINFVVEAERNHLGAPEFRWKEKVKRRWGCGMPQVEIGNRILLTRQLNCPLNQSWRT